MFKIYIPGNFPGFHAAAELFQQMTAAVTGVSPDIVSSDDGITSLVTFGSDAENLAAHQLIQAGVMPPFRLRCGSDAYQIVSCRCGERTILFLAGGNLRSLFYAVYDYFEKVVGCHYFWDGDVIPRREELPIDGIDIAESPRFQYRGLRYFAHRGLKRFQAEQWDFEDWKQEFDWVLKKRLNFGMLRIGLDDLYQKAFPDVVPYPELDAHLPESIRRSYDDHDQFWSLRYRGELRRKVLEYGRSRGLLQIEDCGTMKGIWISAIVEGDDVMLPLKSRLIGRFCAQDIRDPIYEDGRLLVKAGEEFTPELADLIEKRNIQRVLIRSVLTCEIEHGVCVKCYGRNLASDKPAEIGDALGIIAAQSIGEPGTQLTMRTFHIGGTATSKYTKPEIVAKSDGTVRFENIRTVENENGEVVIVNKNGFIVIYDAAKAKEIEEKARERAKLEAEVIGAFYNRDYDYWADAVKEAEIDRYTAEVGAILYKKDGDKVKANDRIATWDSSHLPIIAEDSGTVELLDLIENVTLNRTERGGNEEITVMPHREDLHPQIVIKDKGGDVLSYYPLPAGAFIMTKKGAKVRPGVVLARVPRQQLKNKDITGGLPRVAELFEARTPKEVADIAKIDGLVEFGKVQRSRRQIIIRDPDTNEFEEHSIPTNKHLFVAKGDYVKKGQKLTGGSIVPQVMLSVCGSQELQRYLVNEIQTVYRSQGVEINDKHIEIIIRQMMQKIRITEQGSTQFLVGEQVDKYDFQRANEEVRAKGLAPAEGEPVLLGITKASLETDSFISSASFQDTTRILTDAATLGKVDHLRGFKENVITGHLIPAGTGSEKFQRLVPQKLGEELPPELDILEDDSEAYSDEEDSIQEEYVYDSEESGNDLEEDSMAPEEGAEEEE